MNILKSGGTLFLAYEGRMGRAIRVGKLKIDWKQLRPNLT